MPWPPGRTRDEIPEDEKSYFQQGKEYVQRKALEVALTHAKPVLEKAVKDSLPLVKNEASFYAAAVWEAMAEEGLENHNPAYLKNLARNPLAARDYASQRVEEALRTANLVMHPREATWQAMVSTKEFAYRSVDYYRSLDSGRKLGHATRAFADTVVDEAGDALASAAFIAMVVNLPGNREKTAQMMDRIFPTDRMYGRHFRRFIPRMVFAKPIARLAAMPGFFAGYMTYRQGVTVGQQIEAREELQSSDPRLFSSLEASHRDWLAPSSHQGFKEAIAKTSLRTPLETVVNTPAFAAREPVVRKPPF